MINGRNDRTRQRYFVIILIFIGMLPVADLSGQSARRLNQWFQKARGSVAVQDYSRAIGYCQQILSRDSSFLDARLLLADIYNETGEVGQEIFHLNSALRLSNNPLIFKRLGEAYLLQGLYGEAMSQFALYLDATGDIPDRKDVERKMDRCRFALNAIENPVRFDPVRMSDAVNSATDEYWPALSIDQKALVFTRLVRETGQPPREDLFVSVYGTAGWMPARAISGINSLGNEGTQSISSDGQLLFFTACNRPDGFGRCDIYYATRSGKGWSRPVNAGKTLNSAGWEGQPSISSDNRYLYFSSNRPGGKGGKDLWRAECLGFNDQGVLRFNNPENLGDSINSPGDEISPFIHAGNTHLYFASDYPAGMGKNDLFFSRVLNDSLFSKPVNLGYPINTMNDEQGLFISADGRNAYFASARDSLTGLDIYTFELDESVRPTPATYVKARVIDAESGEPVQASVKLENIGSGQGTTRVEMTGSMGELMLSLPVGNSYAFSVSEKGYLFYSNVFDLREPRQYYEPYSLEIALVPVRAGTEMNLYNIYFETDSFRILSTSEPELQLLVTFLKDNERLQVEIQGHTDSTGKSEKNQILSSDRAKAVVDYLLLEGISRERLRWIGYGSRRPVASNDTPEARQLNRRTTIRILSE